MAEPVNNVSQPPFNAPMVEANGLPSRAWSNWFRDLYRRTAYKGGNAIDDLATVVDGEVNTLEEVVVVVLDHEERITSNEGEIDQNKKSITDLEHLLFGDDRPEEYADDGAYLIGDYIVNPSDDEPQSYYRAIEDMPGPAGPFNFNKWKKVSVMDNDAYIQLTREQAKAAFVAAGYGGIGVDASNAIGTINSTFQTIEGFDVDLIATPLDVTYDKANHGLKLDRQGLWEFTIKVTLTFDEVNAGRQIQFRSYNATTATPGGISFNYFVGRNQAGVNIPLTIAIDIPPANVGDLIQLQVGSSADTFTNSSNIGTIYQVKHISERKEDLGA